MNLQEFRDIERKAMQNDALALNELAKCYLYGNFVEADESKAVELFEKSISLGCPNAMVNFAQKIRGVDKPRSDKLLQKAAIMNFAGAYFMLGYYANAKKEKIKYFSKAAELGDALSYYHLGAIYHQMKDNESAYKYWKIGADDYNEPDCTHNMAIYYATQINDYETALLYAQKSLENGNAEGERLVQYLKIWNILQKNITGGQEVKYWTNKKGESEKTFSVGFAKDMGMDDLSLTIFAPRNTEESLLPVVHFELLKCKDFVSSYQDWADYKAGNKTLKEIRPSQKAKYIVSIFHAIEDKLEGLE